MDVTVADWADNSTVVHYDAQRPQLSDNAGAAAAVDYRVVGVPTRRRFPVGVVVLTYEATDAAGNTASCVQKVRVRRTNHRHSCRQATQTLLTLLAAGSIVAGYGVRPSFRPSVPSAIDRCSSVRRVYCRGPGERQRYRSIAARPAPTSSNGAAAARRSAAKASSVTFPAAIVVLNTVLLCFLPFDGTAVERVSNELSVRKTDHSHVYV